MAETSTKADVREFILQEFLPGEDPADLTDDLQLITTGILDSIATLKLIMHLEERYNIKLEAHEADRHRMDTVGKIAELIDSKRQQGQ
jgi:acyl carrier protein